MCNNQFCDANDSELNSVGFGFQNAYVCNECSNAYSLTRGELCKWPHGTDRIQQKVFSPNSLCFLMPNLFLGQFSKTDRRFWKSEFFLEQSIGHLYERGWHFFYIFGMKKWFTYLCYICFSTHYLVSASCADAEKSCRY